MNKNFNQLCDENIKVYAELTNFFYENILKDTDNMQDFINKINKHFNFNLTLDDLREELRSSNRFIIINNDGLKLDISIYNINVEVSIWNKFYDKNNTSYNRINVFERKDYEFLNLYKSFKDFIDKPLYKMFNNYFKNNQEKIDYFLNVLQKVKEDKWKYEYESIIFAFDEKHIKTLKYDNIKITHTEKVSYDAFDEGSVFEDEIEVFVDNKRIFKTDDDDYENAELLRQIIKFVEQVRKQQK